MYLLFVLYSILIPLYGELTVINAAVMFYFRSRILAYNMPTSLIRNRLECRQTKSKNKQQETRNA